MKKYTGKLDKRVMQTVEKRAYRTYGHQRERCYQPTHKSYKYYGAKKIKVEYGPREFIGWFTSEWKKIGAHNSTLTKYCVGRVDHDKNYSFNNIEMVTKSENSKERVRRLGPLHSCRPIRVINLKTGEERVVESSLAASGLVGTWRSTVFAHCNGRLKKTKSGFTFRYADGGYR